MAFKHALVLLALVLATAHASNDRKLSQYGRGREGDVRGGISYDLLQLSGPECAKAFSNCATCMPEYKSCAVCKDHYMLDADSGYCISAAACETNCAVCSTKGQCLKCVANTFITAASRGICMACGSLLDGCKTCTDAKTCSACKDGYYFAPEPFQTTCVKECKDGADNCETCSELISGGCATCKAGYIPTVKGQCRTTATACVDVVPNCAVCETNQECTTCAAGFTKVFDGKCLRLATISMDPATKPVVTVPADRRVAEEFRGFWWTAATGAFFAEPTSKGVRLEGSSKMMTSGAGTPVTLYGIKVEKVDPAAVVTCEFRSGDEVIATCNVLATEVSKACPVDGKAASAVQLDCVVTGSDPVENVDIMVQSITIQAPATA